jgi:hypothetical protein
MSSKVMGRLGWADAREESSKTEGTILCMLVPEKDQV